MKILFKDIRKGIIKVLANDQNDLWHLSNLITKGCFVKAKTTRAVKIGQKEERKPVTLKIEVEKTSFSKLKKSLRIHGIIVEGKPEEYVQKGKHHSIEIKEGEVVEIEKEWLSSELKRLNEAVKESKKPKAYIVLVEENKVLLAKLLSYGIEEEEIYIHKSKKKGESIEERDLKFLERLEKDKLIIVAGPGFSKLKVAEFLKKRGYKVTLEDVSYAEISGIIELIEKGALKKALEEHHLQEESKVMGEFEKELVREGLACYGVKEVERAINLGSVKTLLISEEDLESFRELIKKAEKQGAKIVIFSSHSPWGKKMKGLKIAALLRFPIT